MNITYIGALVSTFPVVGYPIPAHLTYQCPVVDLRSPIVSLGAMNFGVNGPTYKFVPPGPTVQPPYVPQYTISAPGVPPPMQLSTNNGTLQGTVDGINTTFTMAIYLHRARIFVNGVLQTQNVDVGFGGTAMKFLPQSIPQPGDIITVEGYVSG